MATALRSDSAGAGTLARTTSLILADGTASGSGPMQLSGVLTLARPMRTTAVSHRGPRSRPVAAEVYCRRYRIVR